MDIVELLSHPVVGSLLFPVALRCGHLLRSEAGVARRRKRKLVEIREPTECREMRRVRGSWRLGV